MPPYVPIWPVLEPLSVLLPWRRAEVPPFPVGANGTVFFHAARYAIYHAVRALGLREDEAVLAPAYHHGNEVRAIRAAGARVRFYGVDRSLAPDLDGIERLAREGARVLFAIHYLGWPQPLPELAAICRRHGLLLMEDCALAFLSEAWGRPLGSFGDYSFFCLYKTVPVPNGGVVVGGDGLSGLDTLALSPPGALTVSARTADLLLEGLRSHADGIGRPLMAAKSMAGRALSAAGAARVPVGDAGFDLAAAQLRMCWLSRWLLGRFDYAEVRARRRANFRRLHERLAEHIRSLPLQLSSGICPLFFPILVDDKKAAASQLKARGVETIQFWNEGDAEAEALDFPDVRFLRRHVLELPVHQHLTLEQVDYVADQVLRLGL